MSVFRNTNTYGVSNMNPTDKPDQKASGQIYMKSDGLLYYLDSNNDEFLLSSVQTIDTSNTTESIILTKTASQTISASPFIEWDITPVQEYDTIYLSGGNTSIINICTSGVYHVQFNIILNCIDGSAIGSDPYIAVNTVVNAIDAPNSIIAVGGKEQIMINSGNFSYSQSYSGMIELNAGDILQIKIVQASGSTSAVLAGGTLDTQISLSLNKIFSDKSNGGLLIANAWTRNLDSGVLSNITWDAIKKQNGGILVKGDAREIIKIQNAGYYYVTYNIDLTNGEPIIGVNPEIESYITLNDADSTTDKRFGRHYDALLVSNGNLSYKSTISNIIKVSAGDQLRFKINQTTGSDLIQYSAFDDFTNSDKVSSVNIRQVGVSDIISLDRGSLTITSGVDNLITWDNTSDQLGSIISLGTTTSRIEVTQAGIYDVVYTVEAVGSGVTGAGPTLESYILVNNDAVKHGLYFKTLIAHNNNVTHSYTKTTRLILAANDYIELHVIQTTGSTNFILSSVDNNRKMNITMCKIWE